MSDEDTKMHWLVQFRYLLHGWTCRLAGKYDRSGKHVGFGKNLRNFSEETISFYQKRINDIDVRNRTHNNRGIGRLDIVRKPRKRKLPALYDNMYDRTVEKPQHVHVFS
jgi:hypothetical protein